MIAAAKVERNQHFHVAEAIDAMCAAWCCAAGVSN